MSLFVVLAKPVACVVAPGTVVVAPGTVVVAPVAVVVAPVEMEQRDGLVVLAAMGATVAAKTHNSRSILFLEEAFLPYLVLPAVANCNTLQVVVPQADGHFLRTRERLYNQTLGGHIATSYI